MYALRFARDVLRDLRRMPAFHRARVLDTLEAELRDTPTSPARNRKLLVNLVPPWTAEPPIWELRIGAYRVFYDASADDQVVYIRAIRRKPARKTTEEIL